MPDDQNSAPFDALAAARRIAKRQAHARQTSPVATTRQSPRSRPPNGWDAALAAVTARHCDKLPVAGTIDGGQ